MAHRQKEVVITQQLTSFNYSKRARSFHLYCEVHTERMQNAALHTFVCVVGCLCFFLFFSKTKYKYVYYGSLCACVISFRFIQMFDLD